MNHGIDLDAMRGAWGALDRRIDDSLAFDAAALRGALAGRMHAAFARHSRWLVAGLVLDAAALLALAWFGIAHRDVAVYATSAVALWLLVAMETATDFAEWRTLRALDFDAPVLEVRVRLQALRARRLRTTGAIVLFSIALWLPFVIVAVKALFGGDLLAVLHWSVAVINLVVGLLLLPLGAWIGRSVARRMRGGDGLEQFLDELAGHRWRVASARWSAYAQSDASIAHDGGAELLQARERHADMAQRIAAPRRALLRVLGVGIAVTAVPALAMVVFNASSGGQVRWLVPGLAVYVTLLAHLIANMAHWNAVRRLDAGAAPAQIAASVAWMAAQRVRLARVTLVLLPAVVIVVLAVLVRVLSGADLFGSLSMPMWIGLGGGVALACWGVARLPQRVSARVVAWLCVGVIERSDALARVLLDARDSPMPSDRLMDFTQNDSG